MLAAHFGLGGGIVIAPAPFYLYLQQGFPAELCMHLAVGNSLASVVFTSLTLAMTHHRHGAVRWPVVRRLWPGIVAGAALGAVGLASLPDAHRDLPGTAGIWLVGTGIGALSSSLSDLA